ncbi:DAK2 domain-containing protein [Alicyclobacillus herbarius]|uniref:DAK2 domain-containing protein n=1 Tax=Alicyclobacillus herbarius TaxID=122960 RepID=UPI0003FCCE7B|nr:DAK2 domain-containing protein [Alicyclobacillus herbarius]
MNPDQFISFFEAYAHRIEQYKDLLDQLDNQIGDGDHGTNVTRGFQAAWEKCRELADADTATAPN